LSEKLDPEADQYRWAVRVWWGLASWVWLCKPNRVRWRAFGPGVVGGVVCQQRGDCPCRCCNDWPATFGAKASLGGQRVLWWRYRDSCAVVDGGRECVRMMSIIDTRWGIVSRALDWRWWFRFAAVVLGGLLFGEGWTLFLGAYRWGRSRRCGVRVRFVFSAKELRVGEDRNRVGSRWRCWKNLPFFLRLMKRAWAVGLVAWNGSMGPNRCWRWWVWPVWWRAWVRTVSGLDADRGRFMAWHVGVQAVVLFRFGDQ